MTFEALQARVTAAIAAAESHANACKTLVEHADLAGAIEHCVQQGVASPQCSLTAESANARRLREAAARKLSDPGWWTMSLEAVAVRRYEAEQAAAGNVRNYVSDGLFAYTQLRKSKK